MIFSLVPKFHQKSQQKIEFESDIEIKLKLKSLAALAPVSNSDVRAVFRVITDSFPNNCCKGNFTIH